jgi:hypothetical protein
VTSRYRLVAQGTPQYDWRELQRWKISEGRLPAGSVVRFRELTVWEQYRWPITLIWAVVLFGLLFERRRRRL